MNDTKPMLVSNLKRIGKRPIPGNFSTAGQYVSLQFFVEHDWRF